MDSNSICTGHSRKFSWKGKITRKTRQKKSEKDNKKAHFQTKIEIRINIIFENFSYKTIQTAI